jgi:hypothetical protein
VPGFRSGLGDSVDANWMLSCLFVTKIHPPSWGVRKSGRSDVMAEGMVKADTESSTRRKLMVGAIGSDWIQLDWICSSIAIKIVNK